MAAPATLNPATGDPSFNPFYQWAYDPLVILKADGTFAPGLATDFGYVDKENKIYELTLREGVQFSDGEPLDAEAVKSWLEYQQKQPTSPGALTASIDKIEVTSPLSLRIQLNRSDPGYNLYFAQAFGAGYIASPKAVADPTILETGSAGAGPYMIDPDETVASDHYTYVPNPHYWNPEAIQFDKVVLRVVTNSSSMIQAMRAGQIQGAQGDATTLQAAKDAGLQIVSAPQAATGLNLIDREGTLSEPLADPRVRRALSLGIDRAAIAEGLYGDEGLALSQWALPGAIGFDEAIEADHAFDPDEAKSLLAEAGYPEGFKLSALTTPVVGLDKVTEAIAGQLAGIGVELELTSKGFADFITSMTSAEYPAAVIAYGLYNMNSLYAGFVNTAGPFNPQHSTDPELDNLYEQYFATPGEEAAELEVKINHKLVELGWAIPVVGAPLAYYLAEGYTGIEATTRNSAVPHFPELRRAD